MDFNLSPRAEDFRARYRGFVDREIICHESRPESFDPHENIRDELLAELQRKARHAGLWCPQMPRALGGQGLDVVGMAACYEEMGRSIFGPAVFNCSSPDDGNMLLMQKVATAAQQRWWLQPVIDGAVRSSFAMTEPMPGGGSDPGAINTTATLEAGRWRIRGRKWFISGAAAARHFIVIARTSADPRRGLTAFLFHSSQAGWRIVRRIPVMGPEEHGGHCELEFDGLEIEPDNVVLNVGDGLKVTQIRLGVARLTHCMRWLGMARRAFEIALPYVRERKSFGVSLAEHEGVQWMLGEAAAHIEIGRLLTMRAAWLLDQGDRAQATISMAKIHVAETLHRSIDTAIQLMGARGYSKDVLLEWMYRYARQARLVDGASEVHKMLIARRALELGAATWNWSPARSLSD